MRAEGLRLGHLHEVVPRILTRHVEDELAAVDHRVREHIRQLADVEPVGQTLQPAGEALLPTDVLVKQIRRHRERVDQLVIQRLEAVGQHA